MADPITPGAPPRPGAPPSGVAHAQITAQGSGIDPSSAAAIGAWRWHGTRGLQWSHALHEMVGSDPDITPDPIRALCLIHSQDRARAQAALTTVMGTGAPASLSLRARRPDGEVRHLVLTVMVVETDSAGRPCELVGAVGDTTQRVHAEHQARQTDRLEALTRLAGSVAHDFNNALLAATGNLEILREELDPGHPAMDSVEEIERATVRCGQLVKKLMVFSRGVPADPQRVDLDARARSAVETLRRVIEPTAELVYVPSKTARPAWIDPAVAEMVITHLVLNAQRTMPTGGRITVEVRSAHVDAETARRETGLGRGRHVCILVRDEGEGFAPEALDGILEPLQAAPDDSVGLSLPDIYGIARQAGGTLRVESVLGQGTTVRFIVPRLGTGENELVGFTPQPMRPARSEVVLLVDDEDEVRAVVGAHVGRGGFALREAADAAEAIEILEREEVAVLLTDMRMPGADGLALADRARALRPALPIVFMSGHMTVAQAQGVQALGGRCLSKPFGADDLWEALDAALARQS
jgi:signal transduction histidine kinase